MSQIVYNLGYGKSGIIGSDSAERLLLGNMYDTEEWRFDQPSSFAMGYSYRGLAKAGSATSSSIWDVVRISYDNNGNVSRYQYRSQIVWDSRSSGWAA